MKVLSLILMMMTTTQAIAQPGKATTEKKTFSRSTSVAIEIEADQAIVWALLTNAADFPRWNSTVISIEGDIVLHEKIKLKSTLDEKRSFKLKIKEMVPGKRMVWGDSKGNRTYLLEPLGEDRLRFVMTETIGGLMFPMYARYIPPFDQAFEQFAADLKQEAELIQHKNH